MPSSTRSSFPRQIAAPGKAVEPVGLGPLSDLEAALEGSEEQAGKALAAAGARLASLAQRIRQAMAAGIDPIEFARLQAVARACESAQEILDRMALSGGRDARMQSRKIF